MQPCRIALAAILWTAVAPRVVWAGEAEKLDDLSIEQLMNVTVVGASRFEQRMSEAPAAVTVITHDEIAKYGYRTLADILRGQRDFQVAYDRTYSYVGARGFGRTGDYNTRVLIMIDGHRANENIYDSAYFGHEGILDVDLIERVEFVRGAGSSLYGNNAFLGVVNIVTRKGETLSRGRVSAEGGTFGAYQARAMAGNRFRNGLEFLVAGSLLNNPGGDLYFKEFDTPAQHHGRAVGLDTESNYRLFGTVSYGDFTLQSAYVARGKGNATAAWNADFGDGRAAFQDNRGYLDLMYAHAFGAVEVEARAFLDHYDYYMLAPVRSDTTVVVNRDSADNNWAGGHLRASATVFGSHRVVGGVEYMANFTQRLENHDISPYAQYLDLDHRANRVAVFAQDQYTILSGLILNAGLRYDRFETFGGAFSPRTALIYAPSNRTAFKAVFGEAFRAPNNYELFYATPAFAMKANPALQPEKIRNYEVIVEQFVGDNLRLTASAFYGHITRLIESVNESPTPADPAAAYNIYRNGGGVTTFGGSCEAEGRWNNGVQGALSYSLQRARTQEDDQPLVNSPLHMVKARAMVPLVAKRLHAAGEALFMSDRRTLAGNSLGAFAVVNLTLSAPDVGLPGLDLSLSAYNLLNAHYSDPAGSENKQDAIAQDGIILRGKATYRF